MALKAFLLCAGEGTRFRPHTLVLPKPLIPFLNLPICAYNLYLLKMLGVEEIITNTYVRPELLKKELSLLARRGGLAQPAFSVEETLLGSAGGLLQVRDFFSSSSPFFYLNGDSFIWPETDKSLLDLYSTHVESGALVSFLVRPAGDLAVHSLASPSLQAGSTNKDGAKKGYIYAKNEAICSFSKPPKGNTKTKPYEFSGLAVFSPQIFNEIDKLLTKSSGFETASLISRAKQNCKAPPSLHIFKDVLDLLIKDPVEQTLTTEPERPAEPLTSRDVKGHLRVHSVPNLKLLDMNHLSTYLQGTEITLRYLRAQKQSLFQGEDMNFLQKTLDLYTPDWRRYEGDNWFSAELVKNPPAHTEDILFCGRGVRDLSYLSVKGFAVLGEGAVIAKPLSMQRSVLGKGAYSKVNLQTTLKL